MNKETKIAVFGSSCPLPGSERYEEARSVGSALAEEGWTVVTGGYRGVMEAALRGAKEAGGTTIGVTTAFFDSKNLHPNDYVDREIKTPTYADRLIKLIGMSGGYVVMRGGSGTLTELFLSWELEKNGSISLRPLVLFGGRWKRIIGLLTKEMHDEQSFSSFLHLLKYSTDTDEVVKLIREGLALI